MILAIIGGVPPAPEDLVLEKLSRLFIYLMWVRKVISRKLQLHFLINNEKNFALLPTKSFEIELTIV